MKTLQDEVVILKQRLKPMNADYVLFFELRQL